IRRFAILYRKYDVRLCDSGEFLLFVGVEEARRDLQAIVEIASRELVVGVENPERALRHKIEIGSAEDIVRQYGVGLHPIDIGPGGLDGGYVEPVRDTEH